MEPVCPGCHPLHQKKRGKRKAGQEREGGKESERERRGKKRKRRRWWWYLFLRKKKEGLERWLRNSAVKLDDLSSIPIPRT